VRRVDPVAEAGAALVEDDQPRKAREPPQQMRVARTLPLQVEVRQETGTKTTSIATWPIT